MFKGTEYLKVLALLKYFGPVYFAFQRDINKADYVLKKKKCVKF